eukprot:15433574-Alexandrium_andersonii.AAC.2
MCSTTVFMEVLGPLAATVRTPPGTRKDHGPRSASTQAARRHLRTSTAQGEDRELPPFGDILQESSMQTPTGCTCD